jgi:D-amino peptidase
MVRCDMEGASGITSYAQVDPADREYREGRDLFMADLLALLNGLSEGGAEVVVYDEHRDGRNIDLTRIPDSVSVVTGKPPYRKDWPGELDGSFTGLVLCGFHGMAGAEEAVLPHTYERAISRMRLNDQPIGEIGLETAVAGDLGIPLLLVTGDSAAIREAIGLRDQVLGVVVKDARGPSGALCYPLSVTTSLIHRAARQVATAPPAIEPWRVDGSVELSVDLEAGEFAAAMERLFGDDFEGERTLRLKGASVTEAYAEYWRRKLEARAEMR